MTVVVAFFCSDGAVVASDSMITPSLGNINVGHHHGIKVHLLPGPQIFAFAGDHGQALRVKSLAELNHGVPASAANPLDFPLGLAQAVSTNFQSTGIATTAINTNVILSFLHQGSCQCCVFEGAMQPRLLDADHYYVALGVGKLSADPFLRFLTDVFCEAGQPAVHEAAFFATWVVQHVIDVNPGGVAGPIQVAIFEQDGARNFTPRQLTAAEIAGYQQVIGSARDALRDWRSSILSGAAARGVRQPPTAPAAQPAAPLHPNNP
jgi:hypothetical protein